MSNKQEVERLKKLYPLFEFSIDEKLNIEGTESLTVQTSDNSSYHYWFDKYGHLPQEMLSTLDHRHMEKSIKYHLENRFPDLHIYIHAHKDGINVHTSVNNNGREGTGIGNINILSPEFNTIMANWNDDARMSKKDGFFYCSGHQRVEPQSNYGYFYFMGEYCKQYGEENPEHRKMAGRETYN